ncbi:phospholipase D-like domain-containing protein [Bdellovibrio sp. HCB337]|uniref:phospholipase D-like domain-containing protein n=1 Tax=Bdellovibrio sp. HCB337 TaxID=3394358 RepID=UPI0039A514AF
MNKTWEHVQLFHNGDEFFAELISSIRRAKKSITVEFYIFEMDGVTEILLVELQLAVLRGCKVQLLVDGVGSLLWTESLAKRCRQEGIHFRVYHPIPGFLHWLARLPEAIFSKAPSVFERANRRNHRKTVIVDGEFALLGSFNMTKLHFEKVMGDKAWRDSAVKVQGPALESLMAAYDLAWAFARRRALLPRDANYVREKIATVLKWHDLVRLNPNNRIRRHLYKDLCRRILNAKERVYIATAYFLPKRAIARALAKAAKKGVDVRILIPGPTDVPFVKWAAYHLPYILQEQGAKIYEYQPRVFHAKYMVIDQWASLGSSNLNHRSLLHDLEVEAVFMDAQSLGNITQQFEKDLASSLPLDPEKNKRRSFWWLLISKTLFKLRYWF